MADSCYYNKILFHYGITFIGIITFPVFLANIYCIIMKTPKTLKNFRWLFLNQQISFFLFQQSMELGRPLFYYGIGGVQVTGVVISIMPAKLAILCGIGLSMYTITSTIALFAHRFSILSPNNSFLNRTRGLKETIFVLRTVLSIGLWTFEASKNLFENPVVQKTEWIQKFPSMACIQDFELKRETLFSIESFSYLIYAFLLVCAVFVPEMLFYIIYCVIKLLPKNSKSLSKRTRQMQMNLLKILILQEFFPLFLSYTPSLALFYFEIINNICLLWLNAIMIFPFCAHNMLSSIFILLLNKPYRDYLQSLWRTRKLTTTKSTEIKQPENTSRWNIVKHGSGLC